MRTTIQPDQIVKDQARIYQIRAESDGDRDSMLSGMFCSWSCAEAYHDIGR